VADLLEAALDAHGGLDNWRRFKCVQATVVTGGAVADQTLQYTAIARTNHLNKEHQP